MRRIVIVLALIAGCTAKKEAGPIEGDTKPAGDHAGHNMDQAGSTLAVATEPAEVKAGQPATLRLMIHDAAGVMLKDFEVVHEKKVHLIIVREGLDEFAHIHPEIDAAGRITAPFTFPTGGRYRLYADHKAAGKAQATAIAELKVAGESPPAARLTPDVPGRVKGDGLEARVAVDNATAGGAATVRFELTDAADQAVTDLQPYLGAMGHLVILSADGKEYVHAHPADAKPATDNVVVFQAHFTKPGLYKGWGQFRWKEKVRVIPFVVKVG